MGRIQSRRSTSSKKTTLILDATPLIYLYKSNLAKHLQKLGARREPLHPAKARQEKELRQLPSFMRVDYPSQLLLIFIEYF